MGLPCSPLPRLQSLVSRLCIRIMRHHIHYHSRFNTGVILPLNVPLHGLAELQGVWAALYEREVLESKRGMN